MKGLPFKLFALTGLLVAALTGGYLLARRPPAPPPEPVAERRITVEALRREPLMFMVTDRLVTRVVVENDEHSALLGGRTGILVATARIYHGIDLAGLTGADLDHRPGETVVAVPRPRLLEFSIDPDMEFLSKRSGLQALRDWLVDRDLEEEMRERIRDEALAFVRDHELLPGDRDVLGRLNGLGDLLAGDGVGVRFVYREPEAAGAEGRREAEKAAEGGRRTGAEF